MWGGGFPLASGRGCFRGCFYNKGGVTGLGSSISLWGDSGTLLPSGFPLGTSDPIQGGYGHPRCPHKPLYSPNLLDAPSRCLSPLRYPIDCPPCSLPPTMCFTTSHERGWKGTAGSPRPLFPTTHCCAWPPELYTFCLENSVVSLRGTRSEFSLQWDHSLHTSDVAELKSCKTQSVEISLNLIFFFHKLFTTGLGIEKQRRYKTITLALMVMSSQSSTSGLLATLYFLVFCCMLPSLPSF